MQDGRFAFEADKATGDASFEFGRLGFDPHVQNGITESMLARNNLLMTATHVFSLDLLRFLSIPTLTIESIEPTSSQTGRSAQLVKWNCKAHGTEFPRDAYGEIVWLPDDGFLIERSTFFIGSPTSKPKDGSSPRGFSFETQFDIFAGKLLPTKAIWNEPNITYVTELVSRERSTHERKYFTAEAIGLSTPRDPRIWRFVWLGLGVGFLMMSLMVLKRKWKTAAQ